MLQITKMRLPTSKEWDSLVKTTRANGIIHWKKMFSWCQDADKYYPATRVGRGYRSAHTWSLNSPSARDDCIGFRPAFEVLNPDALGFDGVVAVVGTLYMDDHPVRVPLDSIWDEDIEDYIPGTRLEFRPALDDPAFQVKAIKVGNILIGDRVLLKNISWNDLHALGLC